jgi:glutamine amidotransferase
MCELFAMSSRAPTSVSFSLTRLARRGGPEGLNRDGWGVAFYTGGDALLLREPAAAGESELVRHIERHGPPSELVISHIRQASFGERALRNTQPFMRELGGRAHAFAHNGDLPGIDNASAFPLGHHRPIGESDSEIACCYLLGQMQGLWEAVASEVPAVADRADLVAECAARMRMLGPANFLYSDGDVLFVHADRRFPPDGGEPLVGLYVLDRSCEEEVPDLSGSGVILTTVQQALTLVASVPLTDEPWQPLARGEILAIRQGRILERRS